MPEAKKGEYDVKLRRMATEREWQARNIETKQRDNYHIADVQGGLDGELKILDKDPDRLRDSIGRGMVRIESSRLPVNRKEEIKKEFATSAEKRHIESRLQRGDDPDEVLRDIRTYPTRPPDGVRYDDGPQGGGGPVEKDPKAYLQSRLAPGYEKRTSDIDNLHPVMTDRLAALTAAAQEAGHDVRIISGHRDAGRQAVLWDNALKKYGSASEARKHVAPPGGSSHQSGEAVDLQYGDRGAGLGGKRTAAVEWVHSNAKKFGLNFPLDHEDWHIEPVEARQGGKRYGGNYDTSKTYWQGGSRPSPAGGGNEITPKLSAYSPQKPGSDIAKMEGGYAAARKGPDGKAEVRTLDDVASGRSQYITLAGNPNQYGKKYTIPEITFIGPDGKEQTLKNVQGVVHDTGGRFKTAAADRFDVPVARDIGDKEMASQPFLKSGVKFIPDDGKAVAQSPPLEQRGMTAGMRPPAQANAQVADASGKMSDGVVSEINSRGQVSTILDGIDGDQPLSTVPADTRAKLMAILPKDAEKQFTMPDGTKASAMDVVTVGQIKKAFAAPAEQARDAAAVAGSVQRDDHGDGRPDSGPRYSDNAPYRWLSNKDRELMAGKAVIAQREITIKAGEDEAQRIAQSGQGKVYEDGSTYLEKAQRVLTRNQFEKQKAKIEKAQWQFNVLSPLPNMSEAERARHLESVGEQIEATKFDPGYADRSKVYEAAVKTAEKMNELLGKDAAAAMAGSEEVKSVIAQIKGAKGKTMAVGTGSDGQPSVTQETIKMSANEARVALVEARLAAQERIFGDARDPRTRIITKAEALQLLPIGRLSDMDEKELLDVLKEGAARADRAYGKYSREAFDDAVKLLITTKTGKDEAAGVLQKMVRNEPLSAMDMQRQAMVQQMDPIKSFLNPSPPSSMNGFGFNGANPPAKPAAAAPAKPAAAAPAKEPTTWMGSMSGFGFNGDNPPAKQAKAPAGPAQPVQGIGSAPAVVPSDGRRPAIANQPMAGATPTIKDVEWLLQNPAARAAGFDKGFGPGSSKALMEFLQKNGPAMGLGQQGR